MKIYWAGDRGFIEINGQELEGTAEVNISEGRLEVKVVIDINLEDTEEKEVKIDYK